MESGAKTKQQIQHLVELEVAGEDILSDKYQLVELDRKRQKVREALRVVQKQKPNEKSWMSVGNMFVKFPNKKAKDILSADFDEFDKEIDRIRKDLKPKVNKLRDLENIGNIQGFDLTPLSKSEMMTIDGT